MGRYPKYWAQYLGYPPMWNAGGKTFLNFVVDLTRYLLAFLQPNYLSNSQSYDIMNFCVSLLSKVGQNSSMLWNALYVCRRGKSHFDTGDAQDFVPSPQISSNYLSDWQNYGHPSFTSPISPLLPARVCSLRSCLWMADFQGIVKFCLVSPVSDIMCLLCAHQVGWGIFWTMILHEISCSQKFYEAIPSFAVICLTVRASSNYA